MFWNLKVLKLTKKTVFKQLLVVAVDIKGHFMEMEGRGFSSGLYKNSSEELFLKSLMDSPIGMPIPTMDMPSFKAVSQSFRTDSEELFKRWLTNEEASNPFVISYVLDHTILLFSCFCVKYKIKAEIFYETNFWKNSWVLYLW